MMESRTKPAPRIMYEEVAGNADFCMNNPVDRQALAKLREQEARGEVRIEWISLPPQIDQKGVAHVMVFYWTKRLMSDDEIEQKERQQLQELNKAISRGGGPSPKSNVAPSLAGINLTAEERELLAPHKGGRD